MLADVVLETPALPKEWADQAAIFYSWFESVGFNRYDGQTLPEFIDTPSSDPVNVSRTMRQTLPTDVPAHRVPPRTAMDVLPHQTRKKVGAIDISFKEPHLPIGIRVRDCDASQPSSYVECGLAVSEGAACRCWNYVAPFNLETTLYLDKLMALMKLPARAFMYGQMKYWPRHVDEQMMDIFCDRNQEQCSTQVHFSSDAKLLQWSWFGKRAKGNFTPEGLLVGLILSMLFLSVVALNVPHVLGLSKGQVSSFGALNKAICKMGALRS